MKEPTQPDFGHPPGVLARWRRWVTTALKGCETPFHLLAAEPVLEALDELRAVEQAVPVPVRHWLSFKTQPVRPLLRWWAARQLPVEVVSEFELRAALREGVPPERILVNGPAKHRWLPAIAADGLRVNFDSATEARALLPLARRGNWSVGVRFLTREEHDPEAPSNPTQFGMDPEEAVATLRRLQQAGVRLETAHFHLRTNLKSPDIVARAIEEVRGLCEAARFRPVHLDCGGGIPPHHILSRRGLPYDGAFDLGAFGRVLAAAVDRFPGLREVWCENGRFVSARAGVLVTRVVEIKERRGVRQLICDTGRTNSALLSTWEMHGLEVVPRRRGPNVLTVVCGPTCMAFDQLTRRQLPASIRPGDCLVWMDAGAYHLPWETRFSHGWPAVLWHEDDRLHRVRERETFEQWWGQWQTTPDPLPTTRSASAGA